MTVDPATTPHITTHGGEHHYFCSAGCLAQFEADPDRFAVKREPAAADAPEGAIWTCPMHPEIQPARPGSSSIFGMSLEPVMPPASAGPSHTSLPLRVRSLYGLLPAPPAPPPLLLPPL